MYFTVIMETSKSCNPTFQSGLGFKTYIKYGISKLVDEKKINLKNKMTQVHEK